MDCVSKIDTLYPLLLRKIFLKLLDDFFLKPTVGTGMQLSLVQSLLVPLKTNYHLIQLILSFRKKFLALLYSNLSWDLYLRLISQYKHLLNLSTSMAIY